MTLAGVGYTAAILLAVVFWGAGSAKLRAPERVASEFEAMGIRSPETVARVLPAVEFIVAMTLAGVPWLGAAIALAVLIGFTVVLVRVVRSGEVLSCACFGATSTQPVSSVDVLRNVALMVAAVVALGAERVPPEAPEIVAVLGAAAIVFVGLRLLRQRSVTPS